MIARADPVDDVDDCVHQLFEAQTRRTPDATALVDQDGEFTYAQLNEAANRLAWYLRERGICPERLVSVLLDRSAHAIVAMLAVMKTGGAYVPLDPRYPAERTAHVLADCQPVLALTTRALGADRLPEAMPRIELDRDGAPWRDCPAADVDSDVRAANLAYVMYTSGSTGRPKGAAIPHSGLRCLALDQIGRWRCGPGSRVLQFASLGFDASFTEIAVALLSGGTLCLAPRESLMPGSELRQTLRRLRVTALKAPPSVLSATGSDGLPDLELVVNGGGPCHPDLVARWGAGRVFLNAYGVTECSVCSSTTAPLDPRSRMTIGHAIAGTALHVVDVDLRPAHYGEVGELCIAGAGVGRGYHAAPGLTAAAFVPDPYGPPGARMYRTGDLVRRLPDGQAEYVGRRDFQVKVRGNRVDLGDLESSLLRHPAVREAVALLRHDQDGGERLVAYAVLDDAGPGMAEELRRFLAERLPDFLVPAVVVPVERMPLTASGKVDRAALPQPGRGRPEQDVPYVAARTEPERLLARLWSDVLQVAPVGVHDDFFELGGDSLLAARLIALARSETGVTIPLRHLFSGATVAEMAVALDEERAAGPAPGGVEGPMSRAGR
jgi:amino acid adenylation domain-containing protein